MIEPPLPDCLRFESRFESGNLAKVIRITEAYYEIYLRPDYYTSRHCQWFYFQVSKSLVWKTMRRYIYTTRTERRIILKALGHFLN